jgi:hypothetical protein
MSELQTIRQGPYCTAHIHPDLVVEFVFHQANTATIDALMQLYNRVLPRCAEQPISRLIYDTRQSDALPFFYLLTRTLQWRMAHQDFDPAELRMALLYTPEQRFHESFLVRILNQFKALIPFQSLRFGLFEEGYAEGLEWLRAAEAPDHLLDVTYRSF